MRLQHASSTTRGGGGEPVATGTGLVRGGSDGERDRVDVAPGPGAAQRPGRASDRPGDPRRRPRRCRSSPCTGTSTRPCWRATSRSRDPASLLVTPDHYLVRMLVSQGVPHDDLGVPAPGPAGRGRRPARGLAHVRHPLAAVPRHAHAVLARARASSRCSGSTSGRRPTPPTGCTTCSPSGWPSRTFRPLALFDRVRHRDPGHHRRGDRDPRRPRGPGGPRLGRPDRADVPPRRAAARRPPGLARGRRAAGGAVGRRASAGTATWCARSRSAGARSSRPVRAPPTTATCPRTPRR